MQNLLIKAQEALTTFVLNRFVSFDHNIDGSHRVWIDAKNYASLSAAIDACGAAGSIPCTLAITNNQTVSSNKTVPPHVVLFISNGGRITFSGGAILTVQGGVWAGLQQWIFGTGTVVFEAGFIKNVYPQWWGAKGNGAIEDTTAIQAAITAVSTNNLAIYFVAGNYLIDDLNLPNKCILQGEGSGLTKFTRKSGAAGVGMESSGDADDIILKGFELDCDFKGTDGIKLGFSGGAWGESGQIEDVKVTDCAGIGAHLSVDKANIKQLAIINADGGAVGTHQLKLEGDVANVYDLRITGETGTTANIEFAGDNAHIFGMYLDDPHLTKAIRFNGDNNSITGLNIVTEDNTKTYTQLLYFETNAIENLVRDIHIEEGASDTITNSVQDDENSRTVVFATDFHRYGQTGHDHSDFANGGLVETTVWIGSFTRDISLASGPQTISGVGFKPTVILFFAVEDGSSEASWGFSHIQSGDNGHVIYNNHAAAANTLKTKSTRNIFAVHGAGATYEARISVLGPDGFTLEWTKTGAPTGTLTINYLAIF